MSDFNQPTRQQDKQAPSAVPDSQQQTRQTQHGSIERNPDAAQDQDPTGEPFDADDSEDVEIGDNSDPDRSIG